MRQLTDEWDEWGEDDEDDVIPLFAQAQIDALENPKPEQPAPLRIEVEAKQPAPLRGGSEAPAPAAQAPRREADIKTDPARLGWPVTLPLEIALGEVPIRELFEDAGLTRDDYDRLSANEGFMAQVAHYHEELKKDGMSFKIKARLQSEQLLKRSWDMIHDTTNTVPPNVKADLIKFTIKAAGLSEDKTNANVGPVGTALQININL